MGKLNWSSLKSCIEQARKVREELVEAGFHVRRVDFYPDHFLVSTDHGGEGATSRWSSSWVRRYKYNG